MNQLQRRAHLVQLLVAAARESRPRHETHWIGILATRHPERHPNPPLAYPMFWADALAALDPLFQAQGLSLVEVTSPNGAFDGWKLNPGHSITHTTPASYARALRAGGFVMVCHQGLVQAKAMAGFLGLTLRQATALFGTPKDPALLARRLQAL